MNSGICKEKLLFLAFDFNYLQEENNHQLWTLYIPKKYEEIF